MEKQHSYKDVLSQKEYLKMMLAALINRFGDSIDAIASTWIVYQLTNSAAWSALIFGINNLPTVLITPFAGTWVEGRNKKIIMIVTDIIRAIVVAMVASLFLAGLLRPWMLLVSNILISTVEAFRGPADTALTPKVLDEELYEYGMSLHSSLSQIVQLVGMGCAAGIIALIGISGALYIDMGTFIISSIIILFVNIKNDELVKKTFHISGYVEDFKDGIRYVSKENVIVFFLLYTVFINAILVPINGLQAPLADTVLHNGVEILSILSVSVSLGMLSGSITYPHISKFVSNKGINVINGLIIGLFYILIICAKPLYSNSLTTCLVVAILSFVLGLGVAYGNCMMNIVFMKKVDKKYIARAVAIATSVGVAAMPVVSFCISVLASVVNVEVIFIVAGLLDFVVVYCLSKNNALDEDDAEEILLAND
ncbi:MFS transporter [Pseudobutyrivibrio xylanivorans]|nr:MFS transporter [Pseudobutyrivibrio xylanivorans]